MSPPVPAQACRGGPAQRGVRRGTTGLSGGGSTSSYQPLKHTTAFRAVSRRGRWVHGPLLSIGALSNGGSALRVGIRTKRGVKGAVVRNRLKRQVRGALLHQAKRLKAGIDLVIVIHPTAPNPSTAAIEQELLRLCTHSRLLS